MPRPTQSPNSGDRLYCGHTGAITAFDFQSPSSPSELIKTTPSRHKKSGLKGIVASISFSPNASGTYLVGTLNGQIGCYDTRSGGELMGTLWGVEGAVTQVRGLSVKVLGGALRRFESTRSSGIQPRSGRCSLPAGDEIASEVGTFGIARPWWLSFRGWEEGRTSGCDSMLVGADVGLALVTR